VRLAGKRVASYARYSTDKQNPRSVEDQLRNVREWVEREGGTVVAEFYDAGVSGAIGDRPGLGDLQSLARAGGCDVVACEDQSRIARDQEYLHRTLKRFSSWGARFIAINDGIDTQVRGAKAAIGLKALMGDLALDEIRDRTLRGLESAHAAGRSTGGRTYGYGSVNHGTGPVVVINEREASTVRRVFQLYTRGHGLREIAERLNAEAVPSARGGKWNHRTIAEMVRNERYTGAVIFGRARWNRDVDTDRRKRTELERSTWRRRHDASLQIVDAVTWQEARTRSAAVARASSACSWAFTDSMPSASSQSIAAPRPTAPEMLGVPASKRHGRSFQVLPENDTVRIMSPPPCQGGMSCSTARAWSSSHSSWSKWAAASSASVVQQSSPVSRSMAIWWTALEVHTLTASMYCVSVSDARACHLAVTPVSVIHAPASFGRTIRRMDAPWAAVSGRSF
jgi:DNA invertase Pin-like site-specific DNA recombinase